MVAQPRELRDGLLDERLECRLTQTAVAILKQRELHARLQQLRHGACERVQRVDASAAVLVEAHRQKGARRFERRDLQMSR